MMRDRILKALTKVSMFAVNVIWIYYLVKMLMTYWKIPELDYSSMLGSTENAGMGSIVFALFIYFCFALIYVISEFQSIRNYAITLVAVSLFAVIINDSYTLQIDSMNHRYSLLLKQGNYAKSDHSLLVKKAVDDKNIDQFVKLVSNSRDINETILDDQIALLEIVDQITPDLKAKTRLFLSDGYLSMTEYDDVKKDVLKEIQNANLTGEQISMIRSFK